MDVGCGWIAHWAAPGTALPSLERCIQVLATLVLSVGLAVRLAGQVVRLLRREMDRVLPGRRGPWFSSIAALVWRAVALAFLVSLAVEVSGTFQLRTDASKLAVISAACRTPRATPAARRFFAIDRSPGRHGSTRPAHDPFDTDRALFHYSPPSSQWDSFPATCSSRTWWSWCRQAVANALGHHLEPRLNLADRINQAGAASVVAIMASVATAEWIARDLRTTAATGEFQSLTCAPRGLPGHHIHCHGCLRRLLGWYCAIPRIHEWLLPGVGMVLGQGECLAIAVAFAGLSGGIVARAPRPLARARPRTESLHPPLEQAGTRGCRASPARADFCNALKSLDDTAGKQ